MDIIGMVMFLSAFLPWLGKLSGYGLMDRGAISVRFYAEGNLTRMFAGKPAVVLTGLWHMILGSLPVAAGILHLFDLRRIVLWSAMVIGLGGIAVAA